MSDALSAREWRDRYVWRDKHMADANGVFNIRWNAGGGNPGRHFQELGADERHAFAALALHGQPFGFTQKDADNLWDIYTHLQSLHEDWCVFYCFCADVLAVHDKIVALLPPAEVGE